MATQAWNLRSTEPLGAQSRVYCALRAHNERRTRIAQLLAVEHQERARVSRSIPSPSATSRWIWR
jgi:hypothetical protein